ncbi:hypothetical protein ALC56_11948 [Trachymyrmex septentrionalis]|uniref:Uncharacterized protein n=1 Tax=Trachymyrmex septentrionalis TaxID=34720 RepID=A0A195F007_9HYME|nr:hypothetical protein ALC56_11948 [Trachymyrmex septentrionalis]
MTVDSVPIMQWLMARHIAEHAREVVVEEGDGENIGVEYDTLYMELGGWHLRNFKQVRAIYCRTSSRLHVLRRKEYYARRIGYSCYSR